MTKMASTRLAVKIFNVVTHPFTDKYTFRELHIEREYPTENSTAENMNIKVFKAMK